MSTRFSPCATRPVTTLCLARTGVLSGCIADAGTRLCALDPDNGPMFVGICLGITAVSDKAGGHQAPMDMKNKRQEKAKKSAVPRARMRRLRVIRYGHQEVLASSIPLALEGPPFSTSLLGRALRPRITERYDAVHDESLRRRVLRIDAEIADPLELAPVPGPPGLEAWLSAARGEDLK